MVNLCDTISSRILYSYESLTKNNRELQNGNISWEHDGNPGWFSTGPLDGPSSCPIHWIVYPQTRLIMHQQGFGTLFIQSPNSKQSLSMCRAHQ